MNHEVENKPTAAGKCCRLSEEMIMAVVRNRSGMDSGEIDYTLRIARFERLHIPDLEDVLTNLRSLERTTRLRIEELRVRM